MNRTCESCIWGDICDMEIACKYYSPFGLALDEDEEARLESYTITEREGFYSEWEEQIEEFD